MFKGDKKQKKQTSGITLVALVVTIVVLLILAGITITMLFSDSGIINKAREAAEATKNAQSDTEQGLENLEENMGVALGDAPTIKEQGVLVPKDTKYAKWKDETGTAPIPGGYCVVKDSLTNEQNTVKSGLVISDAEGDTLDNDKKGNQFVWVPVPNPSEMYKENNGNYEGRLYDFGWNNNATDGNKLTATEKIRTDTSYREPDVVTNASSGQSSTGGSSYDAKVDNLKKVLDNYNDGNTEGSQKSTASDFKKQLQEEFNAMIASVSKYGGFYIGRYETSLSDGEPKKVQSKANKKSFYNDSLNDWYVQYKYNKEYAKDKSSVVSSTIWGSQYDAMMKWMGSNGINVTSTTPTSNVEKNSDENRITGASDSKDKLCNIYDLLGNSYEWTMEAINTDLRVSRGGYYNLSYSPSGRNGSSPTGTYGDKSSRLSLYVK